MISKYILTRLSENQHQPAGGRALPQAIGGMFIPFQSGVFRCTSTVLRAVRLSYLCISAILTSMDQAG
uniref:Uncharacterized protein n=1 Tax=Panagrellus redivivus TaxID=6233 RepID=A0A7E4W514_PANRE